MMPSVRQSQRGSVLLLSYLMAASTLLVLGQVFVVRSLSETNLTQRFLITEQTLVSAETGLDDAMARLVDSSTYTGTDPNWNGTDAGDWVSLGPAATNHQQFRTRVEPTALSTRFKITAQGRTTWDQQATRTITAYVERGTAPPFQYALFGQDPVSYAVDVEFSAKTDSYNSAVTTAPVAFNANGDVGTNSIAAKAIFVNTLKKVNGKAVIGPTTSAAILNAAIDYEANITGTKTALPALVTNAPITIPYPFSREATQNSNRPNTGDARDWKNEIIPVDQDPPPIAWRDTIERLPNFPPNSTAGATLKPSPVSGAVTWSQCGTIWVQGSLTLNSGAALTLSCPGGATLWVKDGTLSVTNATISGLNALRVDGNIAISYTSRLNFTGTNPILYVRGGNLSLGGAITGLKYLYADASPSYYAYALPDTTPTTSTDATTGNVILLGDLSKGQYARIDFIGAGSILYAEGSVWLEKDAFITQLEQLYSGYLASAQANYAVMVGDPSFPGNFCSLRFTGDSTLYTVGALAVRAEMVGPEKLYAGYTGNSGPVNNYALYLEQARWALDSARKLVGPGTADSLLYVEGPAFLKDGYLMNFNRVYSRGSFSISAGFAKMSPIGDATPTLYADALSVRSSDKGPGTIEGFQRIFARRSIAVSAEPPSTFPLSPQLCQVSGLILAGSSARVYTDGTLSVSGCGLIKPAGDRPTDLLIANSLSSTSPTGAVLLRGTVGTPNVLGAVYAPAATVVLDADAVLYGAVIGRTVSVTDSATAVHYDEALRTQAFDFSPPGAKLLAIREQ